MAFSGLLKALGLGTAEASGPERTPSPTGFTPSETLDLSGSWARRNHNAVTAPKESDRVEPYAIHDALSARGWTPSAIEWARQNVPAYRTERGGGSFFGGDPALRQVGRVEVNNAYRGDQFADILEHELHHAWDYSDQDGAWGIDEAGIRRDALALAQQRAEYARAAQAMGQVLSGGHDTVHINHALAEGLGRDFSHVPADYARRRFGYADTRPIPPTPGPYIPPSATPTPTPQPRYRLHVPSAPRGS